jgi:hypothetical protein
MPMQVRLRQNRNAEKNSTVKEKAICSTPTPVPRFAKYD